MKEYIVCISLAIVLLSLITIIVLNRHYKSAKKEYIRVIVTQIRERDCMARRLERLCIEKNTIEKLLKAQLPKTGNTDAAGKEKTDKGISPQPA